MTAIVPARCRKIEYHCDACSGVEAVDTDTNGKPETWQTVRLCGPDYRTGPDHRDYHFCWNCVKSIISIMTEHKKSGSG